MGSGSGETRISTDVLVIGGGMAGFFTAIKAKEQGLDVTLADKGYVGKTGATHFAEGGLLFFRPERGHKLEEWVNLISEMGEYLNNREWDEIVLKESKNAYNDLVSWGVPFYEEDGNIFVDGRHMSLANGGYCKWENILMINREYAPRLRKKALESGVRVLDRIMFCELLKQEGRIVGAVGIHTTSEELYIFKAKAIVIATGTSSLKMSSHPVHYWTGDGQAMAYRAGAEITGEEFSAWSGQNMSIGIAKSKLMRQELKRHEQTGQRGISGKIVDVTARFPSFWAGLGGGFHADLNAEGGPVVREAWEVHCGRAPLYFDLDACSEGMLKTLRFFHRQFGTALEDKIGLDVLKGGKVEYPLDRPPTFTVFAGSGIWPINKSCATGVPGLYAAGNSCATMVSGASYAGVGAGLNHAAVTGTKAGLAAAEYASKTKEITLDEAELARLKKIACAPMERIGGFSPGWIKQVLRGITRPYYIFEIKHGERLQAALTLVEFVNKHLIPKLKAKDAHEWRNAQEIKNIALITEMRLRASLFRTESRGAHIREDYPRRDDPTWLAWVKLKEEQGEMKLSKEPVPKEWWPDLSKPYEERYSIMFPWE